MKRCNGFGTAALVLAAMWLTAGAQAADAPEKATDFGGYTSLRLDEVGVFVGGFDGRIESMSDGVKIVLISDDPEKKPLPISAREMKFTWPKEGGKKPSRILLEGKVVIEHPEATVSSDRADWEFEKGILTFTGNPVMTTPQMPEGFQAQKIVLDFNENRFQAFGGKAKEVRFNEVGAETEMSGTPHGSASGLLREADIADWSAFLTQIVAAASAATPSPGKRIISLLDAKEQKQITSTSLEILLQNKTAILKQLNRVLANPRLYDTESWKGVDLGPEAQALLAKGGISAAQQTRVNRLLFQSAYPELIAKLPEPAPKPAQP